MYKEECDKLFEMLERTKLKKRCQKYGNNRRGFSDYYGGLYGIVKPRYKTGKQLSRDSIDHPEIYAEILRIGKLVCKAPFSTIQLNKDLQCIAHRDSANQGVSTLISLGPYDGGEIAIQENPTSENFNLYSAKYQPIEFDGSSLTHYNLPHTGTKYSLVFFNC
jgi:hypothetical protein